jgi:phage-related tail fiber protein
VRPDGATGAAPPTPQEPTMSDSFSIGAVTAFSGATLPTIAADSWLLCDGAKLSDTDPKYQALFAVVGYTYGGSEKEGTFGLPDYRGRFLRGTDKGAGNDPDTASRRPHWAEHRREDGSFPGKAGDGMGTLEESGLARPTKPFKAWFPHLPDASKHTAWTIFDPPETAAWKSGSRTIQTNTDGGDHETRPINIYVDYYIKYA